MQKQDKIDLSKSNPAEKIKKNVFSLESLEREKMERDRAGILFSNILSQVRGRTIQKEKLGSVSDQIPPTGNNSDTTFFKTSTNQINYKYILGFEGKREEEEEVLQNQPSPNVAQLDYQKQKQHPGQYAPGGYH